MFMCCETNVWYTLYQQKMQLLTDIILINRKWRRESDGMIGKILNDSNVTVDELTIGEIIRLSKSTIQNNEQMSEQNTNDANV